MKKKEHANFMRIWRMKRNDIFNKEVIARKKKKARFKRIKNFTKQKIFIFVEDLTFIENSKMIWKTIDKTWKIEIARKEAIKSRKKTDRRMMKMKMKMKMMRLFSLWIQWEIAACDRLTIIQMIIQTKSASRLILSSLKKRMRTRMKMKFNEKWNINDEFVVVKLWWAFRRLYTLYNTTKLRVIRYLKWLFESYLRLIFEVDSWSWIMRLNNEIE